MGTLQIFKCAFVFLFFLMAFGCKTHKIVSPKTKVKKRSATFLVKKLSEQSNEFEWLDMKIKLGYTDAYQSNKGSARIRMRRDSIIWIAVSKLGVEAMRIRIVKDTIEILNRIERTYQITNFNAINKNYGIDLDYALLQRLILANPIYLPTDSLSASIDSAAYILEGMFDSLIVRYVLSGTNYRPTKLCVDYPNGSSLQMQYKAYRLFGSNFFQPTIRNYVTKSVDEYMATIRLRITQTVIDTPVKTPFRIPAHYEKL